MVNNGKQRSLRMWAIIAHGNMLLSLSTCSFLALAMYREVQQGILVNRSPVFAHKSFDMTKHTIKH